MKENFFPIDNKILTNKLIKDCFYTFWFEISRKLKDDNYFALILKIQFENENIVSLTNLVKVNKESKEGLLEYILERFALKDESYINIPITGIIFSYILRKGKVKGIFSNKDSNSITGYHVIDAKNRTKIPFAYKAEDYGRIILEKDLLEEKNKSNSKFYYISLGKNIYLNIDSWFTLEAKENINYLNIKYIKNNMEIINWTDKINYLKKELTRTINSKKIIFKDDKIILKSADRRFKPILKKSIKTSPKLNNSFLTADIETILVDGIHKPYLISYYDGKLYKSFFNKDPDKLVKEFINNLFIEINNKKIIYLHNFAGFDVYFIIKYLVKYTKVKPLIHNGQFISIDSKYKGIKITFRDSFKHLPSALDKLAENFNAENKGVFPYYLNDLNYKGSYPDYKYFDPNKLSLEIYNTLKNEFGGKIWSFKEEAIKYCEQDCRSLHQVISKYNELFFNNFNFNIHKYPTVSSLAFANYRTNFMKDENIANITGRVSKEIRLSYTGGALDMYIPKPLEGFKIHAYDVNALYPFVMREYKYPIGNPTYFVCEAGGDILNSSNFINIKNNFYSKDKPFGFFYCKVQAPKDIKHPILQIHHKTKDGVRTISPLGKFEGMFFSEELYNAEKFGYKFEILWGYIFESDYIFNDYVDTLYNMRLEYSKEEPMNLVAKLLLNSLYGRFGMSDNLGEIEIVNKEDFLANNTTVKDIIDLGHNIIIETRKENYELETKELHSNVNIAVASAVTAYARIHMSKFKNNPNLPNLYYTDTDSTYFDGPLPDYLVSQTELGKMKLEGIYDDATFLAPKVYALRNKDENIVKIKGLTKEAIKNNNINIESLNLLLNKDYKIEYIQSKWFRNISKANINILDQIYTLQVTSSKRDLIYNDKNKLIGSKSILL